MIQSDPQLPHSRYSLTPSCITHDTVILTFLYPGDSLVVSLLGVCVGVLGGEEVAAVLLDQGVGRRVGLCPLTLLTHGAPIGY